MDAHHYLRPCRTGLAEMTNATRTVQRLNSAITVLRPALAAVMDEILGAVKSLIRRPLYTLVAVGTLALGLAAGVGVFTYFNGFFQPFPGADPHRLVQVFDATEESPYGDVSYLDFLDYAQGARRSFEGMAATRIGYAASIRHEESTEVVFLEAVSGSYFDVLGVELSAGRGLTPADDRPDAGAAAVISYAWWQRQWNGDPGVVGSTVYFNSRPYTVVGVVSPRFHGSVASYNPDAWLPFDPLGRRYTSWSRAAEQRGTPLVRVIARLRLGADPDQAADELRRVAAGLDDTYPRASTRPRRPGLAPATWIDPRARLAEANTVRVMLLAAATFLLLVCANVGNLLLAMAAGRRREMALRAAMGASRGRLLRQVLLESALMAGAAGGLALGLSGPTAMRLGSYFARPSVWGEYVARQITVDSRVVWFALGVSLLTSILAGILPAVEASRRDLAETLKTGAADGEGPPRRFGRWRAPGLRHLMVSAQVALSVVLLVVAALTLRTLGNAASIDPGFEYPPLLGSYISTSSTGVTEQERDLWFRTLAQHLSDEPWVRSATIATQAVLTSHPRAGFRLEGQDQEVTLTVAPVIPGYFSTLGMHVLRGRDFALSDSLGAPGVAVVNEAFLRQYYPGEPGVGRQVWMPVDGGTGENAYEIVGVVNDARLVDLLADVEPVVYLSNMQQGYASGSALMVAATIDPDVAVQRLYGWLRAYEPHVAIVNIMPYDDVVRGFTYAQRMNAQMFTVLAVLGLLLAMMGIFSVMSLAVTQRTREIGVRMAVGAHRVDIGVLVVGRAAGAVLLGLALGVVGSLALAKTVGGLLIDVDAKDPMSITAAALILLVTALLAALVPAHRAASVDPQRSLTAGG